VDEDVAGDIVCPECACPWHISGERLTGAVEDMMLRQPSHWARLGGVECSAGEEGRMKVFISSLNRGLESERRYLPDLIRATGNGTASTQRTMRCSWRRELTMARLTGTPFLPRESEPVHSTGYLLRREADVPERFGRLRCGRAWK
jgi:hypothetical protein